jgi:hypothetical protein
MSYGNLPPLSSIAAVRPVFLIVMGVFLMVIAWRLAKSCDGWTARLILTGALMLGVGYSFMLPLFETGLIGRVPKGAENSAISLLWPALKMIIMNGGWLLFGTGLALHARIFAIPSPKRKPVLSPVITHEFTA